MTTKDILLHHRSSTRLAAWQGRETWTVSMWRRIGKRGRAGTDEHWIWRTLAYLFVSTELMTRSRKKKRKIFLFNDHADGERLGRGMRETRRNKLKRVLNQETSGVERGPVAGSRVPTVRVSRTSMTTHLYIGFHSLFFFTESEIQVKVIVQILSALELRSKVNNEEYEMVRDCTNHNGSFGAPIVSFFRLCKSETLRSRGQRVGRVNIPVPRGQ